MGKLSHADFGQVSDEPDEALFASPVVARRAPEASSPAPSAGPAAAQSPGQPHALVSRLRLIAAAAGARSMPVIDLDAPQRGLVDDLEPDPASPAPGVAG